MTEVPDHVKKELDTFSQKQKNKFYQLLAWSGNSGFPGSQIDFMCYEKILQMVRHMGEDPIEPSSPDGVSSHNMEFREHINKWVLMKQK